MFKTCRNQPEKLLSLSKLAKSGSAWIRKCVLTSPSGGNLYKQGQQGFQNCGKLLINKEPARGRCCPIFNVTAYSNVKLHILGKAIYTILLTHLWIDWLKYMLLVSRSSTTRKRRKSSWSLLSSRVLSASSPYQALINTERGQHLKQWWWENIHFQQNNLFPVNFLANEPTSGQECV